MKKEKLNAPVTAIIGGTSLKDSAFFSAWKTKPIRTEHGVVQYKTNGTAIFLQRHGKNIVPPHMINHRANILAMKKLGVKKIIAVNSVGSLKATLKPGTFVIPDDFISLWQIPTFFDRETVFTIPEMDKALGKQLYNACREQTTRVRTGGTYIQTTGPRFETKAEIRMLKNYGHIVGMTMASEATLCMEYDISYASLCSIDNYCNGIIKVPLTMQQITDRSKDNIEVIEAIIEKLITRGI